MNQVDTSSIDDIGGSPHTVLQNHLFASETGEDTIGGGTDNYHRIERLSAGIRNNNPQKEKVPIWAIGIGGVRLLGRTGIEACQDQ